MLEVKNLYREYKPKKGAPVVALNEVSVKFPDKGLIFILGKSGSGKSTLLNVMGGLDKSDSGEIIIKGKSSIDFKQSDFDSYRNTYLGFIFQEYNILDEFNVGQNIALALELQGRKATSEEINKILDEVDLTGYATRKTNELSGGQKQRVAIARALVKNPEIIFADEPTGALDSKTGTAVFDTLKKLSLNKLVVVVSHDREFAELYGDRVIELADGNIISDIEKTKVSGTAKSKGVTIVDDKVIKINQGYELTAADMEVIREYLNKSKEERLISLDGKVNENVRHIARIDELGNKESFVNTKQANIKNAPGEFNSIKSKLSLKHCFRIGGASLKVKPFRLLVTILLSIVAFAMFGVADTMGSYEKVSATLNSIREANYDSLVLAKEEIRGNDNYTYTSEINSNAEDIASIKEKYGVDLQGVYSMSSSGEEQVGISSFINVTLNDMGYYITATSGLVSSSANDVSSKGFNIIAGSYPTNSGEIAITKHLYSSFEKFGYKDTSSTTVIKAADITKEKIIGNNLSVYISGEYKTFKITAVIDTNFDTTPYEELRKENSSTSPEMSLYMLSNTYKAECKYGYHTLLFTNDATISAFNEDVKYDINGNFKYTLDDGVGSAAYVSKLNNSKSILLQSGKTSLNSKETLITDQEINSIVNQDADTYKNIAITPYTLTAGEFTQRLDNMFDLLQLTSIYTSISLYAADTYEEAVDNGMKIREIYDSLVSSGVQEGEYAEENNLNYYYSYIAGNLYSNTYVQYANTSLYDYHVETVTKILKPYLNQILNCLPKKLVTLDYFTIDYDGNRVNYDLYNDVAFNYAGIKFLGNNYDSTVYLDDETVNLITTQTGEYSFLIGQMPTSDELLTSIIRDNYDISGELGSTIYTLQNGVMPSFNSINSTIESMAQAFLYIGIGFAIFASLMLFNFISISISYKKREIGILRAVGARSKDVFHIFFAEAFIISVISYVFATVATFFASNIINTSMNSEFNLGMVILSPGIRQVALILAVCLLVAVISTALPVYKIAMKRPIDAIKDR